MSRFRQVPNRRDILHVGAIAPLGLGWRQSLARDSAGDSQLKSCILIWLDGGPSHLDWLDPKPEAPEEVRGPFGTISTSVPGIQVSELMPRTAAMMEHSTIIRSMTSPLGEHNFGTQYLLTGYKPTPALAYPSIGSTVARFATNRVAIPPHVAVPDHRVGGGDFAAEGFLPSSTAPFEVGGDPAQPDFHVRDLQPFSGMTDDRLMRRRAYLRQLNGLATTIENQPPVDPVFEQAYRLMMSRSAKDAFDLSKESDDVRQQYGLKSVGQCCLLARRLIEAGVPFVTVNCRGWDTHNDLVTRLRDGYTGAKHPVGLVPSLDMAYSSLIRDLSQRGLLDQTLVVVMGEFGRTPKINPQGGRDHWPRVFSVMLAGGGVPGGQIIGQSDDMAESPHDRPVTPADLAATIYRLLGLDPQITLQTPDGRPVKLSSHGHLLSELI